MFTSCMEGQDMIARRSILLAVAPLIAGAAPAWGEPLAKGLEPLSRFIGAWKGTGDGEPGRSAVERSYEVLPGGNFIVAHNKSTYAPQAKNPKGEIHTDIGWYSFDRAAKSVILRQFHPNEAFVNTYAAAAASLGGDTWVFTTVAIENIAAGYRARETYKFHGPDAFDELFEVAEPGKEFATYSLNRLSRA
jgi:hypothetical protein